MTPLRERLGSRFERYIEDKIAVVPGDITNPGLLSPDAEPFKRDSLDAVVHSAGLVNFEASLAKAMEVNTTGVANVLDFCRKSGATMLHISTCYVAGAADGHRYEDDIPENWCPIGKKNFTLEQEIRDALGAIARVEAESRDHVRNAELPGAVDEEDETSSDEPRTIEHRRKRWVEERLKEVGKQRSLRDRKSTRLNSSHSGESRMPSSA